MVVICVNDGTGSTSNLGAEVNCGRGEGGFQDSRVNTARVREVKSDGPMNDWGSYFFPNGQGIDWYHVPWLVALHQTVQPRGVENACPINVPSWTGPESSALN